MVGLGGFAKDVIAGVARRSMFVSTLGMKNGNEILFGE
jgi:hypothetical protein